MIGCLCIGCRADREAFLAVPARLGGDLRDKTDLPSHTSVEKTDSIVLLDLSAVSHAQTAKDAEGGLLFETVFVGAVLLSQVLQHLGVRSVGQKLLYENLASLVDVLRLGRYLQSRFRRGEARSDEVRLAAAWHFHDAKSASAVGFQLLVVANRRA